MTPHQQNRRARPGLEPLEDRLCLNAVSFQNHILQITGDNTANTVTVRDDGIGDVTASIVDSAGHKVALTAHGVQQINLNEGTGNDKIDYALTGILKTSEKINLTLGKGNDRIGLDFSKGVSAPALGVNLQGGLGSDAVTVAFGAISGTQLNFLANLGTSGWPGSDQFKAQFTGAISGAANVNMQVNDGNGYDGLGVAINGDIGALAQVSVHMQGGKLPDVVRNSYRGQLNGKLTLYANGGPGGNFVMSDVTLNAGSKGTLVDSVLGGTGDDLLILQIHNYSGQLKQIVTQILGNGGKDQAMVTPGVQVKGAVL